MKHYLWMLVVMTLVASLAMGGFNYYVDISSVFRFKEADADRLSRIDQFFLIRLNKPWQLAQIRPTAVIVGTSRSATVRPLHPEWPQVGAYNLSVPGMTVYELRRFIEHAAAFGSLEKLMIGLDFEVFIHPEPQMQSGFEEWRMLRNADDLGSLRYLWQFASDASNLLFTFSALSHSVAAHLGTVEVKHRYFPDGTWNTHPSELDGREYLRSARIYVLSPPEEQLDLDSNMEILVEILRLAHQKGIETRLFVTPVHVFMIELWWRFGHGELWNDFYRRLIAANSAVAAEFGSQPFPLYGFNHLKGVVDEPIRMTGHASESALPDGVHFSYEFGQRIMEGVWTDGNREGFRLDEDTIEGYLSRVTQLREAFERRYHKQTSGMRARISPLLESTESPDQP